MRTKSGIVISDINDRTIVVKVDRYEIHPIYKKRYRVSKKFHAHDEKNEAKIGDIVEISECRPLSKLKCWKLDKIVAKSAQAIVSTPAAVESDEEAELRAIVQKEKKVAEAKAEDSAAKTPKKPTKK